MAKTLVCFFLITSALRKPALCWGTTVRYPLLLVTFNFYWDWKRVTEEHGTSFKQYLEAIPLCFLLWCIWNTSQAVERTLLFPQKLGKQKCTSSLFLKFTSQFRLIVSKKSQEQVSESRSWRAPRIKFLPFWACSFHINKIFSLNTVAALEAGSGHGG